MTFLAHIADRVLNRPLLITPDKAEVILSVLGGRIGIDPPSADRFEGEHRETNADGEGRFVPYRAKEGVAIITITGSLVNRGAWIGASSGVTSYEGIKHQVKKARSSTEVDSVILDLQSPGGEAVGAFEAAEQVRLLAAEKRTIAIVNGMAASAAYAIASAAGEIVTTETGVSGSIGVVLLHADYSKRLASEGIKPTLIYAGGHKVDGNPFEPLPDAVRTDLQAEIDAFYGLFLKTVATGRGARLTADAARATQARTFVGEAAVAAGIADRLGTFESVLTELTGARGGRSNSRTRDTIMSEHNGGPAAGNDAGLSQADHAAAVATARHDGEAAGAAAERARFAGLMGREDLAAHPQRLAAALDLAIKAPAMSADDIASYAAAHVTDAPAAAEPAEPGAALANREAEADPLGGAAGGGKPESGLSQLIGAQVDRMTAN